MKKKTEREIRIAIDEDWDMLYFTKRTPEVKIFRITYVICEDVPKIKIL